MSNGTTLNPATTAGGDKIFNIDNGDGSKTPATVIVAGASTPYETPVSATNPLATQLSVANAAATASNPVPAGLIPSSSAALAPSWSPNLAAVSANAVKSGAGNLRAFIGVNRNTSARYFQIWDSLTVGSGTLLVQIPVDGSTSPAVTVKGMGHDFFGPQGIQFSTGLSFGFSTTNTTYIAATAADHDAFIAYK